MSITEEPDMKFWHKAASDIFIIIVTASENSGVLTKKHVGWKLVHISIVVWVLKCGRGSQMCMQN